MISIDYYTLFIFVPIVVVLMYLIFKELDDYYPFKSVFYFFILILFIAIFGGIFWW